MAPSILCNEEGIVCVTGARSAYQTSIKKSDSTQALLCRLAYKNGISGLAEVLYPINVEFYIA